MATPDDIPSGQWGTVTFEVPDTVKDVRQNINTLAEALIAALDIALDALALVKAGTVAYLDPRAALIQALVDEIKKLLNDLSQIGLYLTGDWGLLSWPYAELRGGFAEYERRMVARLTDRNDPTRPNLSPETTVAAAFFYLSVPIEDVDRLVTFVQQLVTLWRLSFGPARRPPVPLLLGTSYPSVNNIKVFRPLAVVLGNTPPSKVRLSWTVEATTTAALGPVPTPGPGGFLIAVSTTLNGLPLVYSRPKADTDTIKDLQGKVKQPAEYGPVLDEDGLPVVLHGGHGMLSLSDGQQPYHDGLSGASPGKVFGVLDLAKNAPVPLELLRDGDKYWLQRTFRVGNTTADKVFRAASGDLTYQADLELADMPRLAEFSMAADGTVTRKDLGPGTTFYVRVLSATTKIGDGTKTYKYNLSDIAVNLGYTYYF